MTSTPFSRRAAGLAAGLVLLFIPFVAARLWFRDWGSSALEQARWLPGDAIVSAAASQGTRAIDIAAPPATVWAWLAQTGQDRGGFHSYELLEDLVGGQMENLPFLDPSLQHWKLGDKLWMYPPHKLGGVGHAVLLHLEDGRALGFGTRQIGTTLTEPINGSWSFVVEPTGEQGTRLLIRSRAQRLDAWLPRLLTSVVFDPAHFVMERKMMEVIKARAEGRPVSEARDNATVVLWFVTFAVMVAAGIALLAGRQPLRRWMAFVGAGLLLEISTLVQPSLLVGGALLVAVALFAFGPRRPWDRRARATAIGVHRPATAPR